MLLLRSIIVKLGNQTDISVVIADTHILLQRRKFLQVHCPVILSAWVLPHQSYVRKCRSYPLAPFSLLLTSSLIKALG